MRDTEIFGADTGHSNEAIHLGIKCVVEELFRVLTTHETRKLVLLLVAERDQGLVDDADWHADSEVDLKNRIVLAVYCSIFRVVLLQINADRKITDAEVKYAAKVLQAPLAAVCNIVPGILPPTINGVDELVMLDSALKSQPSRLLSANGFGGRQKSLLLLCAYCDPFAEAPILSIILAVVRELCTEVADVDGRSSPEVAVLKQFERVATSLEVLSADISARLPKPDVADLSVTSSSSAEAIRREFRSVEAAEAQNVKQLRRANRRSKVLERCINESETQGLQSYNEGWSIEAACLLLSCLSVTVGVGLFLAGLTDSISFSILICTPSGIVFTHVSFKKYLGLTWYSAHRLRNELRQHGINRYRLRIELQRRDEQLTHLEAALRRATDREQSEREAQRIARRQRSRRQVLKAYYASGAKSTNTGGPVFVNGYFRADGTWVAPHTRRRPR